MQRIVFVKLGSEKALFELNIEKNPSALPCPFEHGLFEMDKESMIDNRLVDIKSKTQYYLKRMMSALLHQLV